MARIDVTQETVLERIVEHLRDDLSLNDRQCYLSLYPEAPPIVPVGGEHIIAVSPGAGRFVQGEQQVGNVTEEWSVVITAYARIELDSADHDEQVLMEGTRGLLALKRVLLESLVGEDIETAGGDTFLRQLLYARSASQPNYDRDNYIAWISLEFGVDFDSELT